MKRLIAGLLSIYILFLTVVPCADSWTSHDPQQTLITQATGGTHQNECDHCSPFCTCKCCTSPITSEIAEIHLDCFALVYDYSTLYYLEQAPTIPSSFWQPPKLG
ncbi:MAG: hypothetical protein Q8914_14005 [Bacteroidota bacterium]|nr:hypothetical protein [Bacteroidota bacterium]